MRYDHLPKRHLLCLLIALNHRLLSGYDPNSVTTIVWRVARRSLALASVRYRALLPALSLQAHGFRSLVADKTSVMPWDEADLLVFSKAFGAADVAAAREASERGLPVALDLCDNIFMPAYGAKSNPRPADAFRAMARYASLISCTTEPMAQLIREQIGGDVRVCVIPDSVETDRLVREQQSLLDTPLPAAGANKLRLRSYAAGFRRWLIDRVRRSSRSTGVAETEPQTNTLGTGFSGKTIVWFGNHGSEHGDHGLNDILRFREALEAVASEHDVRLLVVTNHRSRFEQLIAPIPMQTDYLEWSPSVLAQALAVSDITIVPNSLDEFSVGKSANRSVMSLCAGVPVVATPTSALLPLGNAVWTGDPAAGLRAYLSSRERSAIDVRAGRALVEQHFSLEAVGRQWRDCLGALVR